MNELRVSVKSDSNWMCDFNISNNFPGHDCSRVSAHLQRCLRGNVRCFSEASSYLSTFLHLLNCSRYFSHYNKGGDDYIRVADDDYTGICGCFSRLWWWWWDFNEKGLSFNNFRCEHPTSKHCHHSCGDDLTRKGDGGWYTIQYTNNIFDH